MKRKPVSFFIIAIACLTIIYFIAIKPHDDYPAGKPGEEIVISIQNGALGSEIAADLQKLGVVKRASAYIRVIKNDPTALGVSPGEHRLQTRIPAKTALVQLLDQKRFIGQIEVKEGSTLSDVLTQLKQSKNIDQSSVISRTKALPYLSNTYNSLEGQLFPARYSFVPGTTYKDALQAMVGRFHSEAITTGLKDAKSPYTSYQLLIISSLVQIEGDPSDFSKVARVIFNRLKIGMPLQLNSTVQYAANLRGHIALSTAATQIRSPYNTYRNVGLPPTPISNPSTAAIAATLNPESGDWLYFITVKPGDTRFTKDYAEFQKWEVLYSRNLRAGAFK